jgi:hypothetical protein
MANTIIQSSSLANPLATAEQLSSSGSNIDGVSRELQSSAIFLGARLTQIAGILLRLPQDTIAQAIVIFTRFWIGPDGGSLREYSVKVRESLNLAEAISDESQGCFHGCSVFDRKAFIISKITKEYHQRFCLHRLFEFSLYAC